VGKLLYGGGLGVCEAIERKRRKERQRQFGDQREGAINIEMHGQIESQEVGERNTL
jgi:hypothetical protein